MEMFIVIVPGLVNFKVCRRKQEEQCFCAVLFWNTVISDVTGPSSSKVQLVAKLFHIFLISVTVILFMFVAETCMDDMTKAEHTHCQKLVSRLIYRLTWKNMSIYIYFLLSD
jgi:hypothetical protein